MRFDVVPPVESKILAATFSDNEGDLKTSFMNGGFSEYKFSATLCGESQLKA